jgi:hemoglobin
MSIGELHSEKEIPIYELIGGASAVSAAVEAFYARVLADPSLKGFFVKSDMKRLKARQIQFLTTALGGPALYQGPDMKKAHAHLAIEQKHFDAVAGHLVATLKALGVAEHPINQIVAAVAPLASQIVNTKSAGMLEER